MTETIEAQADLAHDDPAPTTEAPVSAFAAVEAAKAHEALSLIDLHLGHLQRRELVSSDEMSDLLLDLRMLLTYVPDGTADPAASN